MFKPSPEANELLESVQIVLTMEAKTPDWMLRIVRNPATGRKVQVRSLPQKDQERYRPKKAASKVGPSPPVKKQHDVPGKPKDKPADQPKEKPKKAPAKEPGKGDKINIGVKAKHTLHHAWHHLAEPFKAAYGLATDKKQRKAFAKKIGDAVKSEVKETKQMAGTFRDIFTGKKVKPEAKKQAVHQLVDVAKVVMAGAMVGHLAHLGIGKLLASLASPVDEIVGAALDGPLRKATSKLFGHEHGLLPSAFYSPKEAEGPDFSKMSDDEIIERMAETFLQAMESETVEDPEADDSASQ